MFSVCIGFVDHELCSVSRKDGPASRTDCRTDVEPASEWRSMGVHYNVKQKNTENVIEKGGGNLCFHPLEALIQG